MSRWITVGLQTRGVAWPNAEIKATYGGHEFVLRPGTDRLAPAIAMRCDESMPLGDAQQVIRRFLSALSWQEQAPISEADTIGAAGPVQIGRRGPGDIVTNVFRTDHLAAPTSEKARLALALYREAQNLKSESVAYSFLGYFKVINVTHNRGAEQIAWINGVLSTLKGYGVQERIAQLRAAHPDVGAYLYLSGRCAVAHAFSDPLVDPEDPTDLRRLATDLDVVRSLAEHLIENELSVPSLRAILAAHLYELRGFHDVIGTALVRRVIGEPTVSVAEFPTLPVLKIAIRGQGPFAALSQLTSEVADAGDGRLFIRLTSPDARVYGVLALNFATERLEFDPFQLFDVVDDGSAIAARVQQEILEFAWKLLLNGQMEVWDAEAGRLLGRSDPFVPVNVDFRRTEVNVERSRASLATEIARREALVAGPAAP